MNKKAFASICMAIFVAMLGLGVISPLMSLYASSMGATGFWLGMMFSGFSISRMIVLPIAGWLSDTRGRKGLMIIGLGGYTIISVLYAASSNIYQLVAVRFLHGVGSAMVIPIAQAYAGDLIPEGKEGRYMNLYSMVMFMGMAAGPLMGGFLSDIFEVNTVFYAMGAFAALALLLLVLTVPNMAPPSRQDKVQRTPFKTMLRDNRMKAISLFMASRCISMNSIIAFLPLFAVNTMGMSRSMVGTILSAFMFTEAISGGVFGPLADRFDKRKLMIIGCFLGPSLLFFMPSTKSALGILAVLLPIALMGGLGRAPAMAYNVQSGRRFGRMGSSMGLVQTAMAIGQFFGPMVSGQIMDNWGIGQVYYFAATVGVISSFFISYWLFKKEAVVAEGLAVQSKPAQSDD